MFHEWNHLIDQKNGIFWTFFKGFKIDLTVLELVQVSYLSPHVGIIEFEPVLLGCFIYGIFLLTSDYLYVIFH